jgi:hypothetical protein
VRGGRRRDGAVRGCPAGLKPGDGAVDVAVAALKRWKNERVQHSISRIAAVQTESPGRNSSSSGMPAR